MQWLGRFLAPRAVRQRGAFHVYAARDAATGVPRTVVVPAPELTASSHAAVALQRLADAHAQVSGPGIPALAGQGRHEGVPWVALACDAALDAEAVIDRVARARERVGYEEAMAIVGRCAAAVGAAHAAKRPQLFGALSWGNVLVTRSGDVCLFGLGHNVVVYDELGAPSGAASVFAAPEVAAGAAASPGADVCALVLMMRSVLAYTTLPEPVEQAFRLDASAAAQPIPSLVAWVNANVVTAAPDARATMRQYLKVWTRELELLGVEPDAAAVRARLSRLVADVAPAEPSMTLGPEAAWVGTPSGEVFELRPGPLRRLTLHLARQRRAAPGVSSDVDALLEAGWPGENPQREAGLNRVYVALSTLRKLGLREVLERDEQGYRIAPSVVVHFETV